MKTPYIEVELDDLTLDTNNPLYFDVETDGLYGKIRLAQFYQKGDDAVQIVNWPGPLKLAMLLANYFCVMHTGHYEQSTVQHQGRNRFRLKPDEWADTFYLARLHFYNLQSYSLDDVTEHVVGRDVYADQGLDKKVLQKSNWAAVRLTENQKLYAATDVYYLPQVYEACKEQEDTISYKLDMLTTYYCLDFQNEGMPVIPEKLQAQYQANLDRIAEIGLPINANSYQQVRPYIGSNKSDDLGLTTLMLQGNERAGQVNETRKLLKQNSFLNKFDNADNVIYGRFLPSARSGRLTSKEQNLQQLPRKTKPVFGVPPESDECVLFSDYAQLELRCIAAITGDALMVEKFRDGVDLHAFTAEMLFGLNWTKKDRQVAKTANFNLLYGGGWAMLGSILIKQAQILLSDAELQKIKRKWHNLWKGITAWQEKGISAWRKGMPWETPFGRRYTAKMMTDQLNIKNQGFGSEVAKLALHYMYEPVKDFCPEAKLRNFVHDSYIWTLPRDPAIYEPIAKMVAEAMKEAWVEATQSVKVPDLPMPVETFVGYNWGAIEAGDYFYEYQIAK